MPTAIGRVEQALQDIVKAYKGMKQANGYRFNVKLVTRHLREPDDLDSNLVPAIFVFRPAGQSEDPRYVDSGISGGYESALTLHLLGVVRHGGKNPDDASLATLAEAFLSDIRALQMKDPRFGSAVVADSTLLPGAGNDAAFDSETTVVLQPLRVRVNWDIRGTNLP